MSQAAEREILQNIVPELEAEGYEVHVRPDKLLVPNFLGDFSPDAIAFRPDKNLVIEVSGASPSKSRQLEQLAAMLKNQEKWELRVVWVPQGHEPDRLRVQNIEAMQSRIDEVRTIAAAGHSEPAMLLAWATFEALARAVLTEKFEHPQTPARIVQELAGKGYLTPTEADHLRVLARKRNRLIHGELQETVSEPELTVFAAVLDTMIRQVAH